MIEKYLNSISSKRVNPYEVEENRMYLVTTDFEIYEDEYDYLESIHNEYLGIKDNIEEWENQMLEENTEWFTGEEIIRRLKYGKENS